MIIVEEIVETSPLGRVAYRAFSAMIEDRTISDAVPFDDLTKAEQLAFEAAARAVVDYVGPIR